MKKTRNIIALTLCLILLLCAFSGCGAKNEKITVLCTVFPIYDWVRNVVGESDTVEVKLLVSDGADLHSYEPTAKDALAIKSADIIVRVGGVDDSFVGELTKNSAGVDLRLMEAEGVTLRHVSVSSEHHENDGHDHTTDEHIWLSVKNAAACVEAICKAVSDADPDRANDYRERADSYIETLNTLDKSYADTISASTNKKMVFADRFPFVYMTADYGIEYEAAFEGCTTDAEAGFDTILRLSDKLDEWKLSHLFVTETSDGKLAEAVRSRKKDRQTEVCILNSMQSVSLADIDGGTSYVKIMEENLTVLSKALKEEK